jgi:hypothetical protein
LSPELLINPIIRPHGKLTITQNGLFFCPTSKLDRDCCVQIHGDGVGGA